MDNIKLAIFFIIALTFGGAANAAQGVITLHGRILSGTCDLNIDGVADKTVVLPPVTASSFNIVGKVPSERAAFTLNATGCTSGVNEVSFIFEKQNKDSGQDIAPSSGTAKGVGFAISRDNGASWFNFNNDGTRTVSYPVVGGKFSLPMVVGYIATAIPTTPGTVTGKITISLSYK